ncbi:MAG: tetratricopeptide repeat protein [Deltaproteobacteria bacterium]|nr:MAG: tetratricopeptide repeat protein [Deltaproteobacteria bacterium]
MQDRIGLRAFRGTRGFSAQPAPAAADTRGMRTCTAIAVALVTAATSGCARHARRSAPPEQAEVHVTRAMAALQGGDLDRAEAELTLALEYAPLPTAYNGLGLVARQRGDLRTAAFYFGRAIELNDDFAEAHSNLGAIALEQGDPIGAEEHFRAALAIDPGYREARHNLARALLLRGDYAGARAQLMKLTSADDQYADGWAELALVELALGHRAAADRAIRTALALDPAHATALRARADLARAGGDYAAALADYGAAIAARGEFADALVGRGVTYLLVGRRADALRDLERAVRLAPNDAAARFAYGAALADSGDDRGAVRELGHAIDLRAAWGAAYAEAHLLRAQARERLGDAAGARADYEAFVAAAGDRPGLAAQVAAARDRARRLR